MLEIKMIDDLAVRKAIADDMYFIFNSVKDAFSMIINNQVHHPNKTKICRPSANPALDDWIFVMPAYLDGVESIAGVKCVSRYPGASEGNAHALLILNETISNKPVAIMDGLYISTLRTFAITKLSIDILNFKPKIVCIIGMGSLGRMHATKLKELYPSIEKIKCFSYNAKYEDLVDEKISMCDNLCEALESAEVVVSCGQKRLPYITPDMISDETKLIINLSLFDFNQNVFEKSDIILVDDVDSVRSSAAPLGELMRSERLERGKMQLIGEYLTRGITISKVINFVIVNTLGMAAQDLIIASRVLKRLGTQECNKFNVI